MEKLEIRSDAWISPGGRIYNVEFGHHSIWSEKIKKCNDFELEKRGWAKFWASRVEPAQIHLTYNKRLTNAQAKVVLDWAMRYNKHVRIYTGHSLEFEKFV